MCATPELPVEIWRSILRWTVYTPGLLEISVSGPWAASLWLKRSDSNGYSEFKPLFALKCTLVQVSKFWREMSLEILYEHICIPAYRDSEITSKLMAVLEGSRSGRLIKGTSFHPEGYGWWTKRIDLHITALQPKAIPNILRLLELCHNVEIFVIYPLVPSYHHCDPDGLRALSTVLQTRFSKSLRRMTYTITETTTSDTGTSSSYQHIYLPIIPLETLELCVDRPVARYSNVDPVVWANISRLTLYLCGSNPIGAAWQFPALRHLTFAKLSDVDVTNLMPFIRLHGHRLSSLTVDSRRQDSTLSRIEDLLVLTPNLRYLILDPFVLAKGLVHSYPGITHVGLLSSDFLKCFKKAWITFPNLAAVRIIRPFPLDGPKWQNWLVSLAASLPASVLIEDAQGRVCRPSITQLPPVADGSKSQVNI